MPQSKLVLHRLLDVWVARELGRELLGRELERELERKLEVEVEEVAAAPHPGAWVIMNGSSLLAGALCSVHPRCWWVETPPCILAICGFSKQFRVLPWPT